MVREAIRRWQASFPIPTGNELPSSSFRVDDRVVSCLEMYDEAIEELLLPLLQRNVSSAGRGGLSVRDGFQMGAADFTTSDNVADMLDPSGLNQSLSGANRQTMNQGRLQRAWDVSQRTSRDDWDEWMQRLAIQLLKEVPSAALRATGNLAHAYQPLARELFSAAFACCWKQMSDPYRVNLIQTLVGNCRDARNLCKL